MKIIKDIIRFLKVNKLFVVVLFCASGCATSSYKVINHEGWLTELLVTPDRVIMECEDLQSDDMISYGYSIFVLDDQNTVLPVVDLYRIEKAGCDERFQKIGKILKNAKRVYIAGIGDIEEPRKLRSPSYFFPKHGNFKDNGRLLRFQAILNERGECFDTNTGDASSACPQKPFPLKPIKWH